MKWHQSAQLFELLALAVAILSMSATSRAETAAGPKNAVVLIIRHAEQTEQGDGLSPAGEARAKGYIIKEGLSNGRLPRLTVVRSHEEQ